MQLQALVRLRRGNICTALKALGSVCLERRIVKEEARKTHIDSFCHQTTTALLESHHADLVNKVNYAQLPLTSRMSSRMQFGSCHIICPLALCSSGGEHLRRGCDRGEERCFGTWWRCPICSCKLYDFTRKDKRSEGALLRFKVLRQRSSPVVFTGFSF